MTDVFLSMRYVAISSFSVFLYRDISMLSREIRMQGWSHGQSMSAERSANNLKV